MTLGALEVANRGASETVKAMPTIAVEAADGFQQLGPAMAAGATKNETCDRFVETLAACQQRHCVDTSRLCPTGNAACTVKNENRSKENHSHMTEGQRILWGGTRHDPSWDPPKKVASSEDKARPGYNSADASEYVDNLETLQAKVIALAKLIKKSKSTVVYSGAGISTASGSDPFKGQFGANCAKPAILSTWR